MLCVVVDAIESEFCKTWGRSEKHNSTKLPEKMLCDPRNEIRQVLGVVKCFKWGGCDWQKGFGRAKHLCSWSSVEFAASPTQHRPHKQVGMSLD